MMTAATRMSPSPAQQEVEELQAFQEGRATVVLVALV